MSNLKMIVGLGNPGSRYVNNRHNIGFRAVELYAERHNIDISRTQLKAQVGDGWVKKPMESSAAAKPGGALAALLNPDRQKVLLVKPQTYMNNSGEAVAALANFYKLEPQNILVLHDDLDLPPAKIRLRPGGGAGGQNGVRSIIRLLGTPDFPRLRIGIGRPPEPMRAADYVLQDFLRAEAERFAPLAKVIPDAVDCWLFEGIDAAMNKFN
jgi:PTH1 family peptidyl-tRNA hydrolase